MTSNRRIRLMLFTDSFIHGGTERQFVQTLHCIDRRAYEVTVGCLKRHGPFLAEVEALGLPIEEFPIRSLYGVHTWEESSRLTSFLREGQFDIVHAFDFYTNAFAVPAARRAGVPVVLASRRNIGDSRPWAQRMIIRAACTLAHAVVANSRVAGTTLTGLWGRTTEKVVVIPNGINLSTFAPSRSPAQVREEWQVSNQSLLIGTASALRPEKGVDDFVRVAARLSKTIPEAKFVVAGDGPERRKLELLVKELHAEGSVLFVGDRKDVPDVISALDIFVLSSQTESFPNAILEAMALARPVVATRVGGVPEVVEEGTTGLLAAKGDVAGLARHIEALASNVALRERLGSAARTCVQRDYTPERLASRLNHLYRAMLRSRTANQRVLQIGNYPPPVCGWAIHTEVLDRELKQRGVDARVMDIGPGRTITGRDCVPVFSAFDYGWKLLMHRARGFRFHMHVNGDSWKGYAMALGAVLLGAATGKPAALTFHAGPVQMYFPRRDGFWHYAFRLLFRASGAIICNHEPVKKIIAETYGIPADRIHPIPAFSTQYSEEIPVPLSPQVETFLQKHSPRLFSYSLFRPEFTMDALFDSFVAVRERYPNAGLLIAGPKEIPAEATGQMRARGIEASILIPGNLAHAEFLTAVQRSDVFIRTHLRDGVCTSVLEALQLGVPVVASEDGLRPPSVVKFAPGDARDLTRKTLGVLEDLEGARRAVQRPEVHNHLDEEIAVLLGLNGAPLSAPHRHEARG